MAHSKHIPLRARTPENDIKYQGPLSYRYLRIIAWALLILAQIGMIARANIRIIPASEAQIGWLKTLGEFVATMPLPLFLLANFTIIFQKKGNWKSLFIRFGGLAILFYIIGNFVILHYGYGFLNAFGPVDFMNVANFFGGFLISLGHSGLVFNIFIDLVLCSLLFFFMNFTPKAHFKGKYLYLFRAMIALPIIYEVAGICIKYFVASGMMNLPFFFFFLLPSKPPLMFIAFLILVFFLKRQELLSFRKHNDKEVIKEHRKTNAHSLEFSIIIAIVFVACAILDLIIYIILSTFISTKYTGSSTDPQAVEAAIKEGMRIVTIMGFGDATTLFFIAPITLLYSYTKKHSNPRIDAIIPIAGIVLIIFVYIEGYFQIIVQNIPILLDKLRNLFK